MAHVGEHLAKGRAVAGHFQPHVEAFLHAELFLRLVDGRLRVYGERGAHFARQVQAVGIEVGDGDEPGAGVFDDRRLP